MSTDLKLLTPEDFKVKVANLLEELRMEEGLVFRPFFTLRDPFDQAKMWRQSRTISEIVQTQQKLVKEGAGWLAEVIHAVGPQYGRWATQNCPGQSWHQYGKAIDCYLLNSANKVVWSSGHPGYEAYGRRAKRVGLEAGYYWKRKDVVHLQYSTESVRTVYTWKEIDEEMQLRYGKLLASYK